MARPPGSRWPRSCTTTGGGIGRPARDVVPRRDREGVRRGGRRKEPHVDDQNGIDRINELAHEEHALFEKESQKGISNEEKARLKWLEVRLDQCWGLLHQRRALLAAGRDPNEAQPRDEQTVEGEVNRRSGGSFPRRTRPLGLPASAARPT